MVTLALYSSRERWRPLMHPQERGAFVSTIIRKHIQNRRRLHQDSSAVQGSERVRGSARSQGESQSAQT